MCRLLGVSSSGYYDWFGRAAMESFFSTLKTERLSKKHYRTRDDLRADVFDYIEGFYNPRRRHYTIGYISPVQFDNQKCA